MPPPSSAVLSLTTQFSSLSLPRFQMPPPLPIAPPAVTSPPRMVRSLMVTSLSRSTSKMRNLAATAGLRSTARTLAPLPWNSNFSTRSGRALRRLIRPVRPKSKRTTCSVSAWACACSIAQRSESTPASLRLRTVQKAGTVRLSRVSSCGWNDGVRHPLPTRRTPPACPPSAATREPCETSLVKEPQARRPCVRASPPWREARRVAARQAGLLVTAVTPPAA